MSAKVIGVTGGFCTGKTTVALFLKNMGAYLIDADRITHCLYAKDKKLKSTISREFGKEVFIQGRLSRRKLGKATFNSKKNLKKLCGIVHPNVIKEIKKEIKSSKKPFIVVDAPLLIEVGLHKFVDYVVVVKATLKKRIKRCSGKGFTKQDVLRRSALQIPLKKKIKHADFVIDNNRSKRYAREEVKKFWKKIRR